MSGFYGTLQFIHFRQHVVKTLGPKKREKGSKSEKLSFLNAPSKLIQLLPRLVKTLAIKKVEKSSKL